MYRPLPSFLTIYESNIHGLGLYAVRDILQNIELGITHVRDERFENNYIRTPLGGFFNHSEDPNCECYEDGDFLKLKTIRYIKAGEELTCIYSLYKPK
tara:strand:+ start:56 stop:349 length:294 start_codon:yes stop_codon:yes gene_type:complete